MKIAAIKREHNNVTRIQRSLEKLKKQLQKYALTQNTETTKEELIRNQKIEQLAMKAKLLLKQYEKIQDEIKYYENMYEKVLKKRVNLLQKKITRDKLRLSTMKQRCNELKVQIGIKSYNMRRKKKRQSMNRSIARGIKRTKSKFTTENMQVNEKKQNITKNKKLDKPKILFVNGSDVQHAFTNSINTTESENVNFPECRIKLERISEAQTKQYIEQKRINQRRAKRKRTTQGIITKPSNSELVTIKQNWQTKIPTSILQDIESELNPE
ncbi:uncharacterized protein LOC122396879 [Colletes gigas]|uniref:uncharacterized protein LOC122396879 n=1 Tax=Colletes gigas TaxID=935657 RepID=UPI001C9AE544|nr:uncharacterized protein LOC122396879 [Colletes gigas]